MQLIQRRSLFVTTTVTLTDRLQIIDKSWFRSVEAEFAFDRLSDKPLQVRFFPIGWAIFCFLFGAGAAFGVYERLSSGDPGALGFATIFAFLSIACGYNTLRLRRNDLVFRDRYTNQVLFTLLRGSPSSGAVDQFVLRLQELAQRPNPPLGANRHEAVLFYSKVLQQLLEAEVLLPEEHHVIQGRLASTAHTAPVIKIVRQ